MPVIDTSQLPIVERLPGWRARIFHSGAMTFAHYDFDEGAAIHAHEHEQEEVWNVIAGELEVTLEVGRPQRIGPGLVAVIPPNTRHAVRALKAGRAIVVDHPLRQGFE